MLNVLIYKYFVRHVFLYNENRVKTVVAAVQFPKQFHNMEDTVE